LDNATFCFAQVDKSDRSSRRPGVHHSPKIRCMGIFSVPEVVALREIQRVRQISDGSLQHGYHHVAQYPELIHTPKGKGCQHVVVGEFPQA